MLIVRSGYVGRPVLLDLEDVQRVTPSCSLTVSPNNSEHELVYEE